MKYYHMTSKNEDIWKILDSFKEPWFFDKLKVDSQESRIKFDLLDEFESYENWRRTWAGGWTTVPLALPVKWKRIPKAVIFRPWAVLNFR